MDSNNLLEQKKKELLFFNRAYEYFEQAVKPDEKENLTNLSNPKISISESANLLRNSMLAELNNLKELISNNPNQKYNALSEKEKETFDRFIKFYSTCPICGQKNHWSNLKNLFFDVGKQTLIKKLIWFMDNKKKKSKKFTYSFGVPCCNCFKLHFEEDFL